MAYTGFGPSVPTAQKSETTGPRISLDYHHLDTEIVGHLWGNMSPFIRSFRTTWTSWMRSSVNQQDGCLQTNARQADIGKTATRAIGTIGSRERIEFTIPDKDQIQYLRAHLAHRDAQLEPGWLGSLCRCFYNASLTPELLKPFDYSLLEPTDKIPDGSASCIAFMNYAARTLQMMICESNMFKHQLMWDAMFNSWRLVFAFLPASRSTPPTFFNVTWKQNQDGKWRTMSTPTWQNLFKPSRICERASHTRDRLSSPSIRWQDQMGD